MSDVAMEDSRRGIRDFKAGGIIDAVDLAILRIVQHDNQLSGGQIGATVGLSASAVGRRLRHLRKTGAIMADVSLVSPSVVGNNITIIIEVLFEDDQDKERNEFEKSVRSIHEVVQCYYIAGRAHFVLILSVPSMEVYRKFTDSVLRKNANIKKYDTAVVMRTVKFTTRLKLADNQ